VKVDTETIRVKMRVMRGPERSTREALLDAARDAVVSGDWERTRMADVAAAAGVSRQTLYNEFGTKDLLARALTMRETELFLAGIEAAVDAIGPGSPADAVRAAVEFTLVTAADNPLVKAVLIDDAGLLPLLTTQAGSLVAAARASMTDVFGRRWPDLPRDTVSATAELVTRLTVSYLVMPGDGADATAEAVATRIAHLADLLLSDPTTSHPAAHRRGPSPEAP